MQRIWIVLLWLVLVACSSKKRPESETKVVHIFSVDEQQAMTVFKRDNIRIIAQGEVYDVPEMNYVTVDTESLDKTADALYYCWDKEGWEAILPGVRIIDMKLDTSKFNFSTQLPLDDRGIPTALKFSGSNCNVFDFSQMKLMRSVGKSVLK